MALALAMGSRWAASMMPVPTRRRSVTMAAAVMATTGSRQRQYCSGRSPPPGHGVSRLAGMWVCSGTQSESNPRASASRASSTMPIERSVGNIVIPKRMAGKLAL